jgi:threonylcarbamoyladenosine tRNA methylthiotransferase MtaB
VCGSFRDLGASDTERVNVNDIMSVRETALHMIEGFGAQARAYVQIQNGCDHRCTFCIIPYGRGPSRSVPAGEVVTQVRRHAENGYAEIVLTGVDITAYGADLPGEMTLGKLVRKVLVLVPELKRLRLSSIDSVEADDDLYRAIAEEERLMPHLHLSLQAGDDLTLKRMKRRHSREESVKFCETAQRLRPDIVFGADLIAGFPTETEAMFANSMSLVDDCGLTFLHVFPFSARPGTPAARMRQLNGGVIAARAAALREKGVAALKAHLASAQGRRIQVLMESDGQGRAADFTAVKIEAQGAGHIVDAVVNGHDGAALLAVVQT